MTCTYVMKTAVLSLYDPTGAPSERHGAVLVSAQTCQSDVSWIVPVRPYSYGVPVSADYPHFNNLEWYTF